jgi:hypothetical protein
MPLHAGCISSESTPVCGVGVTVEAGVQPARRMNNEMMHNEMEIILFMAFLA